MNIKTGNTGKHNKRALGIISGIFRATPPCLRSPLEEEFLLLFDFKPVDISIYTAENPQNKKRQQKMIVFTTTTTAIFVFS